MNIIGCARNVSESWQEEEGAKKVSLFLSSCLPSSYFPQLTSLITLAVLHLCATLTHPFPLTFAHHRLQGHKCLYSISYFLPETQEGVVRICLLRWTMQWVSSWNSRLWIAFFQLSAYVFKAPTEGLSETETILFIVTNYSYTENWGLRIILRIKYDWQWERK